MANQLMKKLIKRFLLGALGFFILAIAITLWADRHITQASVNNSFDLNAVDIPCTSVALVLGTNPKLKNNKENRYFSTRIEAASNLYKRGLIKHFILSGDNSKKDYDEPEAMRQALILSGVPDSCITLDYAGFRTFDSIIRCKKVFGQNKVAIISQAFHNQRALFLAQHAKVEAIAINAMPAYKSRFFSSSGLREKMARVKACLDVYVLPTKSKFLGKAIQIEVSPC